MDYKDLDEKQREIVDIIVRTNKNLFIQGRAGTGKSEIIKIAKQQCKEIGKNVALISFTGLAAQNINGRTIHSFFKISPKYIYRKEDYKSVDTEVLPTIDTIIIDEISMVTPDLFELIEYLCRKAKAAINQENDKKPFGGIQMILVGDLYQLSPFHEVAENDIDKEQHKAEIKEYLKQFYDKKYEYDFDGKKECEEPFFFDTEVYKKANFETMELIKVYRQKDDEEFLNKLYNISRGIDVEDAIDYFNKKCRDITYEPNDEDTVIITIHREAVKEENNEAKENKSILSYGIPSGWINPDNIDKLVDVYGLNRYELEKQQNPEPFDESLDLFEGAKVMFIKNDRNQGFKNGLMGIVIGFVPNTDGRTSKSFPYLPKVRITTKSSDLCGQEIDVKPIVERNEQMLENQKTHQTIKQEIGKIMQIPLRLAYAITVNKSQGQTLNSIYIKPESGDFFAFGQLYVALSRVKSIENLHLARDITPNDVLVSKRAKDFLSMK